MDKIEFSVFWDAYDKKIGAKKCHEKWDKLDLEEQMAALKHIKLYVKSTPNKQYRKNPETYLNNDSWEDEIIDRSNNATINKGPSFEQYSDIINDIRSEFSIN